MTSRAPACRCIQSARASLIFFMTTAKKDLIIFLPLLLAALLIGNTLRTHYFIPVDDMVFGYEYGEISSSLVRHRSFSNPFGPVAPSQRDTDFLHRFLAPAADLNPAAGSERALPGRNINRARDAVPLPVIATGWMPPAYPLLQAAVFKVLGEKTAASSVLIILIKIALLCFALAVFLDLLIKQKLGFIPILLFALLFAVFLALRRLPCFDHDFALQAAVVTVGLCAPLLAAISNERRYRILLWVTAMIVPLTNPITMMAFLILSGALLLSASDRHARGLLVRAGIASVLVSLAWSIRVTGVTNVRSFIKSNVWNEFYQSNVLDEDGVYEYSGFLLYQPWFKLSDYEEYHLAGEGRFLEKRRQASVQWLTKNPFLYVRKTMGRVKNALVFLEDPDDLMWADSRSFYFDDFSKLLAAGVISYKQSGFNQGEYQYFWTSLEGDRKEVYRLLSSLKLQSTGSVYSAWQQAKDNIIWRRKLPRNVLRGLLYAGIPFAAVICGFLLPALRKSSLFLCAALYYLGHILLYIPIAHYQRYQFPLLGVQCLLIMLVGTSVLTAIYKVTGFSEKTEED